MIFKRVFVLIILPIITLTVSIFHIGPHFIKSYIKSGFKSTTHFQNTIKKSDDEIIIGFWDIPERILVAKKFKSGYFLIQRDPGQSYIVPRGKNILTDPRTVINNKKFNRKKIKSSNSGLGGLHPPDNFPFNELISLGYFQNEYGEWIQEKPVPIVSRSLSNGFINYDLPQGKNITEWSRFEDLTLPEGILNVGGYGFPIYNNEILQNGKINLLSKGFTHLSNLSAFPRNQWEGKNGYTFNQLYYLIKVAARDMISQGKNGNIYGNIGKIAQLEDNNTDVPYDEVSIQGAIELGKHLFFTACCANSIDDPSWNIPLNESVIMLDEESMYPYSWPGGDSYSFYGYLTQGMMEAAGPDYKIFWYSQPVTRWPQYAINRGIKTLTKLEIENAFNESKIRLNSPGWKNSTWFTDANGAYSKVPFLSQTEIYEKKDGQFVKDKEGKRKFRNEDFKVNIFGRDFEIKSTPDNQIKYAISNKNTGEHRFGREYVKIYPNGSADIKEEYKKQGFEWHHTLGARPYPQFWEPETQLWVDGIYRRADGIMMDLLMLAKLETDKWEISKANKKFKLYGEHRPQTEPWTYGGNSIEVREIGESQIFYDTFMLLLSGGQAVSTWDDGDWIKELPKKGEALFGHDDYWGRYHSKLAAVQTVMRPLQGSKPSDWTYIHFYYPYWGNIHSEVISSGIYYNGKLQIFFLNPTLEKGEIQILLLEAGDLKKEIELIGHEVYYMTFDMPGGLKPNDFKLSYTTIYDRKVKVNGKVTNKISEHYETAH